MAQGSGSWISCPEAGPWTQDTLPETLLVDWKMSAIPKGEIRIKGTWPFTLTTRPYTTQERSWDDWGSQGSREWSIRPIVRTWHRVTFLFGSMKEQLKRRSFAEREELSSVLSKLRSEIPPHMILQVFAD
jgi:hypothetical protein